MKLAVSQHTVRMDHVNGHIVRSVAATDEPTRHRAHALQHLAAALPDAGLFHAQDCRVANVVTTPDFHAGKPVPVGVVVDMTSGVMPHLIGSDIGCGMRMIVLEDVSPDDLRPELDAHLRHAHFQGGRDIALTGTSRHAILRDGVPGLLESIGGQRIGMLAGLDLASAWRDAERMCDAGAFATQGVDPDFQAFARMDDEFRRDAILGTIGGGNHFVEFGVVEQVADGQFCAAAGIRTGSLVLVVHSGSLDFGQRIGSSITRKLRDRKSESDWRILDAGQEPDLMERYLNGLANAANVAFANRFLIGLSSIEALSRSLGHPVQHRLVYDAPHNMIWRNGDLFRHRKGACPARGPGGLPASPYEWFGEPVILPGSMGEGAWLLSGQGSDEGLESSAHGAGRRLSRSEARKEAESPNRTRLVGPVDLQELRRLGRFDIIEEVETRWREEAPDAYKPIETVVAPMVEAGLVKRAARIKPLLTVKG